MSISIPFEELIASVTTEQSKKYDCLIIGSGYGGSVAANTFSRYKKANGKRLKIAVLERGKEYLPGSFPTGFNEAIGQFPRQVGDDDLSVSHDGLYDIHNSETHWILSGNGVGGGSLINAGVMLAPDGSTLDNAAWPQEARKVLSDTDFMNTVGLMLGSRVPDAESGSVANTVTKASVETNKYHSIASLGGTACGVTPTPLAIRLSENEPQQAVETSPCIKCGNCFSGCNFNAKKSLDTNLLAEAQHNGVTVVNGAETLFFEKQDQGWAVSVAYSSAKLSTTQTEPLKLYCDHLIVAAGSIGSTKLLLRSRYKAARDKTGVRLFSEELGARFYGNGDTISSIVDRSQPVTMIANDATEYNMRKIGSTNSGMLDFRSNSKYGLVLQELAVPGALQRIVIELISFTQLRDALTSFKCGLAASSTRFLGLTEKTIDNTMVIAGIGGGRSEGTISAKVKEQSDKPVNAAHYSRWLPRIDIKFSNNEADTSWKKHREKVLNLLKNLSNQNDPGSVVIENPMEDPLGDKINKLFGNSVMKSSDTQGLSLSVHPLGGCVMSDSAKAGVVNVHGQVFKSEATREQVSDTSEVHDNLAVIDGAIVPFPTDVNPALTIASLALNASTNLARKWGWKPVNLPTPAPVTREVFREMTPEHSNRIQSTQLTLAERIFGTVWMDLGGGSEPYIAELRLRSDAFEVDQFAKREPLTLELLTNPADDPAGKLPSKSILRLFPKAKWDAFFVAGDILERRTQLIERNKDKGQGQGNNVQWAAEQRLYFEETDAQLDRLSVLTVPLSGTISFMDEVKINGFKRFFCGFQAWFGNRGWRDIKNRKLMLNTGKLSMEALIFTIRKVIYALPVFMHSGRERQFRYEFKTGTPTKFDMTGVDSALWTNKPLVGRKRFFYAKHSNPINQLMSIDLTQYPGRDSSKSNKLTVDLEYFADVQLPMLQIHKESDAVTGYADIASLATWFFRISLLHYFWIMRKPDKPSEFREDLRPAAPNKEPKSLPGLATDVEVISLPVADPNNKYHGTTAIRLSRFRHGTPNPALAPVLCIHGFSLSWSMYAHETLYGGLNGADGTTLKGGLAAYLARKGHDVWVIDLRSSGSLPTAGVDWEFEEAALIDIPVALEYISNKTGAPKVNVVSHCMGAMKFSMLMMCSETNFNRYNAHRVQDTTDNAQYLQETRNRIGRIVLSQAGPYVRFSPANRLRERLVSVFKNLPNFDLQFEENPDASEQEDVMDRVLNAMPYPEHEIEIENPTSGLRFWVRGRHRMDALYGKTFSLKNMDLNVLERFHDFFGPMSIRMLEQVIWFSRRNQISDTYGGDYKLLRSELRRSWTQDTLWIHGEENKLLDPISTVLTTLVFDECGKNNFTAKIIENTGHQDCLMGKDCEVPFRLISDHFEKPDDLVVT